MRQVGVRTLKGQGNSKVRIITALGNIIRFVTYQVSGGGWADLPSKPASITFYHINEPLPNFPLDD